MSEEAKLKSIRTKIDDLDQKIQTLINERAACAQQVAEIKINAGETEHFNHYAGHTSDVLPLDGVEIRIKDKDGQVVHRHFVYANTLFSEKDITVVKNEDSSKCFVFIKDGNQLSNPYDQGTYKLKFTYHRDIGLGNPILSRFGFQDDEEATMAFSIQSAVS